MRTFVLQVQISADGRMAGPNGEMDWMTALWSDDMNAYSEALHASADCIVLGRKLAEGFIPSWASRRDEPQGEDTESIEWMNNTPKVVFSNTLDESPWENTTIVGGDLVSVVRELAQQPGRGMITYGGGPLVSGLVANNLLDELHLFVHPVAIGAGPSVFGDLDATARLRLVAATPFDCGVTALHYAPNRG